MRRLSRRGALAGLAALAAARPCAAAPLSAPPPWPAFKTRYLAAEGRIVDTGNGGISHSEGQGYGMLMAQAAGDRPAFEALWRWTRQTLVRPDGALFSWRFDPAAAQPVADPNNATDGDLLIAWALMRAAAAWREAAWLAAARDILAEVAARLVVVTPLGPALLSGLEGFRSAEAVTLNPSYWVWPALDAFAAADPAGPWKAVAATGERLADAAAFGAFRLPTDWVDVAASDEVAPAAGRPPRFGFDAVRAPLYLAWSGRWARLAAAQAFWRPYLAKAQAPPAWIDVTSGETAPYAASTGAAAVAAFVCDMAVPPAAGAGDYYSDALGALVWLARRESRRAA
jgi:endoglucanase